jgi:hypothetical protein
MEVKTRTIETTAIVRFMVFSLTLKLQLNAKPGARAQG